jgi:hypothetical protein
MFLRCSAIQNWRSGLNDALILRRAAPTLVTNDGDFSEGGIAILTAHNKLLAACP